MPLTDNSTTQAPLSLTTRMIIGGAIALAVISFFVFGVDQPNPEWGKYWMIRPLIITPLAGALGGLCNYFLLKFHTLIGMNKIVAIILSVIIFLIGLWMGVIVGLDGTMWD